jgi:hypothetical protein
MAFALSPTRTVLWDQIEYSGSPAEFGWVLPITPGAYIEDAHDAWFEALEEWTKVTVTGPTIVCADSNSGSGNGFGCGSEDSASVGTGNFLNPDAGTNVVVVHEGTVGPYETVTLRSTNTGALRTWLTNHNYVVPADIDPVIDSYIGEGADFIALRLIPGVGVQKMTPVRVVTPSGKAILPLRMVQAGTGNAVDIVLYVIAESRQWLLDLHEVAVDPNDLVYAFDSTTTGTTNYLALRDRALAQNNGFSFLTAFAQPKPFLSTAPGIFTSNGATVHGLADAYLAQAFSDDGSYYAGQCVRNADLDSDSLVTETGGTNALASSVFDCGPSSAPKKYSDLAAALVGMHPSKAWLARLEMHLPREALMMDCNVAQDPSQASVSNQLRAVHVTNVPCTPAIFQNRMAPRAVPPKMTFAWALGLFATLALGRRLGRRQLG